MGQILFQGWRKTADAFKHLQLMQRCLGVVAATLVAVSCVTDASEFGSVGTSRLSDSTGVVHVVNHRAQRQPVAWFASDTILHLGLIHGDDPYLFSRIRDVARLSDGGIVVLDGLSGELRRFSAAGRHEWTAGGLGGGPGEFQHPLGVARLADGQIQVEDVMARVVFGPDGKLHEHAVTDWSRVLTLGRFSSECRLVPRFMEDHVFLATCNADAAVARQSGPWRIESLLARAPATLDRVDTIGVFLRERAWALSGNGGTAYMPVPLGEKGMLAVGGKPPRLVFATSHAYRIEVYSLNERPRLTQVLERAGGMRAPSQQELDDAWRAWESRAARYLQLFGNTSAVADARDRMPVPDSVSIVSSLLVDEVNAIWARHGILAPDSTSTWDVFSEDGTLLGAVSMPGNFEPLEIGETYVLGVAKDEFDVEYVLQLRLDRTTIN